MSRTKNTFVRNLRDHLASSYGTTNHYTFGEGDTEVHASKRVWSLKYRDPTKPEDLTGFCFRKDLCTSTPQSPEEILRQIEGFSSRQEGVTSELEDDSRRLRLGIKDKQYLVSAHIGKGYADEISINLTPMGSIKLSLEAVA